MYLCEEDLTNFDKICNKILTDKVQDLVLDANLLEKISKKQLSQLAKTINRGSAVNITIDGKFSSPPQFRLNLEQLLDFFRKVNVNSVNLSDCFSLDFYENNASNMIIELAKAIICFNKNVKKINLSDNDLCKIEDDKISDLLLSIMVYGQHIEQINLAKNGLGIYFSLDNNIEKLCNMIINSNFTYLDLSGNSFYTAYLTKGRSALIKVFNNLLSFEHCILSNLELDKILTDEKIINDFCNLFNDFYDYHMIDLSNNNLSSFSDKTIKKLFTAIFRDNLCFVSSIDLSGNGFSKQQCELIESISPKEVEIIFHKTIQAHQNKSTFKRDRGQANNVLFSSSSAINVTNNFSASSIGTVNVSSTTVNKKVKPFNG